MNNLLNDVCFASESEKDNKVDYKCILCNLVYTSAVSFSKHMKLKHNIIIHACRKCTSLFTDRGLLSLHAGQVHRDKTWNEDNKYKCALCRYTTNNGGLFKLHGRVHSGIKCEVCDVCQKGFTQKSNLKIHRQRHFKGTVDFYCEDCYLSFEQHYGLLTHKSTKEHRLTVFSNQSLTIHHEILCRVCNFQSHDIDDIMEHGNSCHCSNNLVCQTCCKNLALNKSCLQDHARMHQDDNLLCWLCPKEVDQTFQFKSQLITHLSTCHNIDLQRSFVCRYCESLFDHKEEMDSHVNDEHHDIRYKHIDNKETGRIQCHYPECDFCTNSFLLLNKHILEHRSKVEGIDERFATEEQNTFVENIDETYQRLKHRGRPKLNDPNVIVRGPVRKRGRPVKEKVEKIRRPRGRPKRITLNDLVKMEGMLC